MVSTGSWYSIHLHFLVRSLTHKTQRSASSQDDFKSFCWRKEWIAYLFAWLLNQKRWMARGQRQTIWKIVFLSPQMQIVSFWCIVNVSHKMSLIPTKAIHLKVDPQAIQSPITEIIFAAARFAGSGLARLYFDGETATFYELDGTQPKLGHFMFQKRNKENKRWWRLRRSA